MKRRLFWVLVGAALALLPAVASAGGYWNRPA